jgi:hypothetical protein
MNEQATPNRLLLAVAAGWLACAVGAALAFAFLPEWRMGRPLPPASYREAFVRQAAAAGLRPDPGAPRVRLTVRDHDTGPSVLRRLLGEGADEYLVADRSALRAEVVHPVRSAGRPAGRLIIEFSFDGQPRSAVWWRTGDMARRAAALAPLMLAPGEQVRSGTTERIWNADTWTAAVAPAGAGPWGEEHLVAVTSDVMVRFDRRPGSAATGAAAHQGALDHGCLVAFVIGLLSLVPIAAALVLLAQRRLGFANAALLGLLALAAWDPRPTLTLPTLSFSLPTAFLSMLWIAGAWAAGESLLRTARPGLETSLDALRQGRLGPRGGRALLAGCAWGGLVAGLKLALPALAVLLPGVSPVRSSIVLPLFRPGDNPFTEALYQPALVLFALALLLRPLAPDRALAAAALLGGPLLFAPALAPLPAAAVANALLAGVLALAFRSGGLVALLAAGVTGSLLPAALLAALYPSWMPFGLTLAAGIPAVLVLLGRLGAGRSAAAEAGGRPPAFVRRLEEERRIENERRLLERMRHGLLPRALPEIPGCELAARAGGGDLYDVRRDAAGRLWIAAAALPAAGHTGAVGLALVKAALASRISPTGAPDAGRDPSKVVAQVAETLRRLGAAPVPLVLVRFDPASGETRVRSSDADDERLLHLPPGGTLLVASTGLVEERPAAPGAAAEQLAGIALPAAAAAVLLCRPAAPPAGTGGAS